MPNCARNATPSSTCCSRTVDGAQVSVVIPVHNRRRLVRRALRSVLRQDVAPREVIVVDDGSDDGSADAAMAEAEIAGVRVETAEVTAESAGSGVETAGSGVQTIAGRALGVRIIRSARNLGVSAARNIGAAMAAGAWVAFLDSDDEWLPHKLGAQLECIARNPGSCLCHGDEIWLRNGARVNPKRKHRKRGGWIFRHCLPLCIISPSAVMVRRDVLRGCGGFDRDLPVCEDYDLWLRLCARHPVLCVPQKLLVKHGGHAGQLSRRHWGMDRFRVRALEKILQSGVLGEGDYVAAHETLLAKLRILANGAAKRGNQAAHKNFAAQLAHWRETAHGAARTAH